MDFRVVQNTDINIESIVQKTEQQRFKNISSVHSMNSVAHTNEDILTLSSYAVEFKEFREMLEEQSTIRKDERTKSKNVKKKGKKSKYKKYNESVEDEDEEDEDEVKSRINHWA